MKKTTVTTGVSTATLQHIADIVGRAYVSLHGGTAAPLAAAIFAEEFPADAKGSTQVIVRPHTLALSEFLRVLEAQHPK